MSYLEMAKASVPDMAKGIISFWFRDLTKGQAPDPDNWPDGVWAPGTSSMVPPDTTQIVKALDPPAVFYWNAYGLPTNGSYGAFFGNELVIMPSPPPIPQSTVHMALTFGDDQQPYNYYPWVLDFPDVVETVEYITNLDVIYTVTDFPPPYKPYWKVLGGQPVGLNGKFQVANMKLAAAPDPRLNVVPQSFVGLDKDGYLTICLQTNTLADYKGYAFQISRFETIWATQSLFTGVPPVPGPFIPGYWDGFLFHYDDISNAVMGAQPECFVLGGPPGQLGPGGPRITDGTWHHVVLSFDISGPVTSRHPDHPFGTNGTSSLQPPVTATACKAWLAVDDKTYDGEALQHPPLVPNGISAPQLAGMGTNGIFPFGPDATYSREDLGLKPNDIVPQNVWIRGFWGNPRDGLPQYYSAAGMAPGNPYVPEGHFNFLVYTGVEWVLAGRPANGVGRLNPSYPTNPNPPIDFDVPTYNCPGFSIPTHNHAIGTPVDTYHLKHNTGVEMAELQIWIGKSIDLSQESMRRLFIEYPKDSHGKPDKSKPLQPVSPSVAARTLGSPDILLHGTENWKSGNNTGKAAYKQDGTGNVILDINGDPIPNKAGLFKPVAKIEKFLPDPKVGV